jgi:hypothetical protein
MNIKARLAQLERDRSAIPSFWFTVVPGADGSEVYRWEFGSLPARTGDNGQ